MAIHTIPDIVRLSRLEAKFDPETSCTTHIRYVSESKTNRRKIRQEEVWQHQKSLSRGGFGLLTLESCVQGDRKGQVRAVKKIQKLQSSDFFRELEAIALFSNEKFCNEEYESCFVKSFGWFESADSVFISMEYVLHGDLQQYMGTALPESEGQHIVFQVLQGLISMHAHNFTHRDLKPANLLVESQGPNWWVKIADFGISKRAAEGVTDLKTITGTPTFMAPEIIGFFQPRIKNETSYTNAVDIWSLGVITFLILTGETLFADSRRLGEYARGDFGFPSHSLHAKNVGFEGIDFVRQSMSIDPADRPRVGQCVQHSWLISLVAALEKPDQQRCPEPIAKVPRDTLPPASASWSTEPLVNRAIETSTANKTDQLGLGPERSSNIGKAVRHDTTKSQSPAKTDTTITNLRNRGKSKEICHGHETAFSLGESRGSPCFQTKARKTAQMVNNSGGSEAIVPSPTKKRRQLSSVQDPALTSDDNDRSLGDKSLWNTSALTPSGEFKESRFPPNVDGADNIETALSSAGWVIFSPDGQYFAKCFENDYLEVWKTLWPQPLHRCLIENLWSFHRSVALSPGGKVLVMGTTEGYLNYHHTESGQLLSSSYQVSPVTRVAYSPTGTHLAWILSGKICVTAFSADLSKVQSVYRSLATRPSDIDLLAYSSSVKRLVLGWHSIKMIVVVDAESRRELYSFNSTDSAGFLSHRSLAFMADPRFENIIMSLTYECYYKREIGSPPQRKYTHILQFHSLGAKDAHKAGAPRYSNLHLSCANANVLDEFGANWIAICRRDAAVKLVPLPSLSLREDNSGSKETWLSRFTKGLTFRSILARGANESGHTSSIFPSLANLSRIGNLKLHGSSPEPSTSLP